MGDGKLRPISASLAKSAREKARQTPKLNDFPALSDAKVTATMYQIGKTNKYSIFKKAFLFIH